MKKSELYNLVLNVTILGLVIFAVLHSRKLKLYRGHMFSNAVKIMIFISDVQYSVPVKLCKSAGNTNLFKITGTIKPENGKLNQNYICDTIDIDWKEVNMTFNSNKINLPKFITIKLRDKFKTIHIVLEHSLGCVISQHVDAKQLSSPTKWSQQ